MILAAMPHPQYGRARYGAIRSRFALLPTTILGTPIPDEVMSVHFDVVLPTASLELPPHFDTSDADDELVEGIRTASTPPRPSSWRCSSPGFAGKIGIEMKRRLVDYSLIGHGRKFELTLLRREREGLAVGSRVEVVGDSVPPRIAEVTAVSPDEKVFEFAVAD